MPRPTKGPRLGGSAQHERHLLANLATQLIVHESIKTTEARARRPRTGEGGGGAGVPSYVCEALSEADSRKQTLTLRRGACVPAACRQPTVPHPQYPRCYAGQP